MKKKQPICKSCYDKGFYTVMKGWYGTDEWSGKTYGEAPSIHKEKCTLCKGRPRAFARQQVKRMLLAIRNGGMITPVLEKIMGWIN